MSLMPDKYLVLLTIPTENPLGLSDKDFSNVKSIAVDGSGKPIDSAPVVKIFGMGKLGALRSGLLYLRDQRPSLTAEDIAGLARGHEQEQIAKKRTGKTRHVQDSAGAQIDLQ